MNGIDGLTQETSDIPLASSAVGRLSEKEVASRDLGSGLSTRVQSADTLISDVRPSEMWRVSVCRLSHPACGILSKQLSLPKTDGYTSKCIPRIMFKIKGTVHVLPLACLYPLIFLY